MPSIRTLLTSGTSAGELAFALLETAKKKATTAPKVRRPSKADRDHELKMAQAKADAEKAKADRAAEDERREKEAKKAKDKDEASKRVADTLETTPGKEKIKAHPEYIAAGMTGDPHKIAATIQDLVSRDVHNADPPPKPNQPSRDDQIEANKLTGKARIRRLKEFSDKHGGEWTVLHDTEKNKLDKERDAARASEATKFSDSIAKHATSANPAVREAHAKVVSRLAAGDSAGEVAGTFQNDYAKALEKQMRDEREKAAAPPKDMDRLSKEIGDEATQQQRHGVMINEMAKYGVHSSDGDDQLRGLWHHDDAIIGAYHHYMLTGDPKKFHQTMSAYPKDPNYVHPEVKKAAHEAFASVGVKHPSEDPAHKDAYQAYVSAYNKPEKDQQAAAEALTKHLVDHQKSGAVSTYVPEPKEEGPGGKPMPLPTPMSKVAIHRRRRGWLGLMKDKLFGVKESVRVDEGLKNVLKSIFFHPSMALHPEILRAHSHIHNYLDTLSPEDRKQVKIVKHDRGEQNSVVTGPRHIMRWMSNHLDRAGMRTTHQKSYEHDVDDKEHTGPDVEKGSNFLHVSHFTDKEEAQGKHLKSSHKDSAPTNPNWRSTIGRTATPEEDARAWTEHRRIKADIDAHKAGKQAEWRAEEEHHETNRKRIKKGLAKLPEPPMGTSYADHKAKMMIHFQNQVRARHGLPLRKVEAPRQPGMEGFSLPRTETQAFPTKRTA